MLPWLCFNRENKTLWISKQPKSSFPNVTGGLIALTSWRLPRAGGGQPRVSLPWCLVCSHLSPRQHHASHGCVLTPPSLSLRSWGASLGSSQWRGSAFVVPPAPTGSDALCPLSVLIIPVCKTRVLFPKISPTCWQFTPTHKTLEAPD